MHSVYAPLPLIKLHFSPLLAAVIVEVPGLLPPLGGGMEEAEPLPETDVVVERDVFGVGRLPAEDGPPPPVERVGAVTGRLVSDGGLSFEEEVLLAAEKEKQQNSF